MLYWRARMVTEIMILLALVAANGLFAGAEIAVLTSGKAKLQQRVARRDGAALAVAALRDQPERFLATVQIGITVISAAAAAFGGSRMAGDLEPALAPLFGAYAEEVAFGLVIALVSFLSLVLGELVPKSLALRYADGYALAIGRPLLGISRIARPVVWLLTACSNAVLRLFGDRTSFTEARVSREELRHMVEEAAKAGSVDARSGEIAARALELADVMVSEVMVRRSQIVAIRRGASAEEVQRVLLEEGHSRMPVYDGELDHVIGYIVARDVLALAWEGGLVTVDDIIRPIIAIAPTARVSAALRDLQTRRTQIAVVVDEHGGVAGLVTMEDLVEEIVGEIVGEEEQPERAIEAQPDGSALVPGWLPIRKLNRALGLDLPIAREATTIAGLCMAIALAVPAAGARMRTPDGTQLEIVDASPRRVRMVRVVPVTAAGRDPTSGSP
jgi:putative hemolysin